MTTCLIIGLLWLTAPITSSQEAAVEEEHDGPVVSVREAGALEGYTLIAPLRSQTTFLVDMAGQVVHTWESELPPGQATYLTDEGHLFRAGRVAHPLFHGGGQGGRLQEFTWEGELVWDVELSNETHHAHHDYELLPNGNVLVLAWEKMSADEVFQAGRMPETISAEEGFWPDAVFEIAPRRPNDFELVWEWHAQDHLVQDLYPERANYGDVIDNPGKLDLNFDVRDSEPMTAEERREQEELERKMRAIGYAGDDPGDDGASGDRKTADWMHSNSIDYHPEYELILISSRSMSEVFVLDHSTTTEQAKGSTGGRWGKGGDLLYRWGNPKNYGLGSVENQRLFVQHDARWLESGDGKLRFLVYNNGPDRPAGEYSTVDEVVVPFHPERGFQRDPGQPFEPERASWTYGDAEDQRFFSPFVSGTQRLANGNTLVIVGIDGRVFEVTRDGQIVWDFQNTHGGEVSLLEPPVQREGGPGRDGPDRGGRGPGGDRPGGPGGGPPGGGPQNDLAKKGLFRATRIVADHPGLPAALRK